MKKFVILLLVFSLLGLTSCGLLQRVGIGDPSGTEAICEIARQSKPTKVTTEVHYVTNTGDELEGYYVTQTDGTNAIFTYYYERLATPAESVESGNSDRILAFEGVINFKDGVYFGDEEDIGRAARGLDDGKTFHVSGDMSYNEWKEKISNIN